MRYYLRYIIIAIIVLVFFIFGVRFVWRLFTKPINQPKAPNQQLIDYIVPDSYVRLTIRGIVNSEEKHRLIRITVSQDQRSIDVLQGYQNHLIKNQTLDNNQSAYTVFLNSLQRQNYLATRNPNQEDSTGACPLGNIYTFELINKGQQVVKSWAGTCALPGTFAGNVANSLTLFQRQIPDYSNYVRDVSLNSS